MIKSIKHKGLKRLYERGDCSGISTNYLKKIERVLAQLDAAETIDHMRLPGYRLHELRGDVLGFFIQSVCPVIGE